MNLHVYARAEMDACAYFHFSNFVGANGALSSKCGQISFFDGKLPENWPKSLYQWSVLLERESAPYFCFEPAVFEKGGWLGLSALADAAVHSLMQQFGWHELPVLWLCRSEGMDGRALVSALPKAGIQASCSALKFQIDISEPVLELSFARTFSVQECNPSYLQ